MRQNGVLYFLLGDHLGSTSVSYKADGTQYITQRYKPWGELRPNGLNALLTKFTYTGQYSHVDDFGLMFYNARWYDPALGRFAQADTIVPGAGNPLAYDRYAYALNNPLRWVDPSGNTPWDMLSPEDRADIPQRMTFTGLPIRLASQLETNKAGAQYKRHDGVYGYTPYYNLCGQISLKVIYESYYNAPYDYHRIIDLDDRMQENRVDRTTGIGDLSLIFQDMFPEGWSATYYSGQSTGTYMAQGGTSMTTLKQNWWIGNDGKNHMGEILGNFISSGSYIIALVSLDPSGLLGNLVAKDTAGAVLHWVTIFAVSSNSVKILDPYCNCIRTISLTAFEATSAGSVIVIRPPTKERKVRTKTRNGVAAE